MSKMEKLKIQIEKERKKLDEMTINRSMEDVLLQSRILDELMEEYIDLAS